MKSLIAMLVATACSLNAGCAFDVGGCAGDQDCPLGTHCARPARTDAPMCLAAAGDADAGRQTPDTSTRDAIPWRDDDTNIDDPRPDASRPTSCPLVTDCGDEANELEAIFLTDYPVGCPGFDFEPWTAVHRDNACGDDVDWFVVEYVACDEGAYKLTVSLTTPDTCAHGGSLEIADGGYDCDDQNVRCEVVEDVERITIIVEDQEFPQPVEGIEFAVRPIVDTGVEYILRATVSR